MLKRLHTSAADRGALSIYRSLSHHTCTYYRQLDDKNDETKMIRPSETQYGDDKTPHSNSFNTWVSSFRVLPHQAIYIGLYDYIPYPKLQRTEVSYRQLTYTPWFFCFSFTENLSACTKWRAKFYTKFTSSRVSLRPIIYTRYIF